MYLPIIYFFSIKLISINNNAFLTNFVFFQILKTCFELVFVNFFKAFSEFFKNGINPSNTRTFNNSSVKKNKASRHMSYQTSLQNEELLFFFFSQKFSNKSRKKITYWLTGSFKELSNF